MRVHFVCVCMCLWIQTVVCQDLGRFLCLDIYFLDFRHYLQEEVLDFIFLGNVLSAKTIQDIEISKAR